MEYDTIEKLKYCILDNGGVLLGSQALRVATCESDTDIACTGQMFKSTCDELGIIAEGLPEVDITNYFNLLPLGNSKLIKLPKLDIIIVDTADLMVLEQAIRVLQNVPTELIRDKGIRIYLFEQALSNRKWKNLSYR